MREKKKKKKKKKKKLPLPGPSLIQVQLNILGPDIFKVAIHFAYIANMGR